MQGWYAFIYIYVQITYIYIVLTVTTSSKTNSICSRNHGSTQEQPVESSLSAWKKSQQLQFGRCLGEEVFGNGETEGFFKGNLVDDFTPRFKRDLKKEDTPWTCHPNLQFWSLANHSLDGVPLQIRGVEMLCPEMLEGSIKNSPQMGQRGTGGTFQWNCFSSEPRRQEML